MKTFWPYLRIAVALLGLVAIARQLTRTITQAQASPTEWGSHLPTVVSNFFSFFTVLSNLAAAIALIVGALWMLRTRRKNTAEPRWLALLLACTSTYMIATGIVYNVLLRSIPLDSVSEVWTNEILHVVVPLMMLLDVLFAPGRRALGWSTIWVSLIFPAAWSAYTAVRGSFITNPVTAEDWWYPYPFLDPHTDGWLSVIAYYGGIGVAIAIVTAIVVWISRLRGTRTR